MRLETNPGIACLQSAAQLNTLEDPLCRLDHLLQLLPDRPQIQPLCRLSGPLFGYLATVSQAMTAGYRVGGLQGDWTAHLPALAFVASRTAEFRPVVETGIAERFQATSTANLKWGFVSVSSPISEQRKEY